MTIWENNIAITVSHNSITLKNHAIALSSKSKESSDTLPKSNMEHMLLLLRSPNMNLRCGLKWILFPRKSCNYFFLVKSLQNWHGTSCRPKLNPNCTLKQPTWNLNKSSQNDLQPWRVNWSLACLANSTLVTFGRPYCSLRIVFTVSCFKLGWSHRNTS